ncbi:MAG: hypothetical protein FD180_69 [Planctomycetota bacterium]|nr:MAG: hypothetical protein FD180_69 [Planctomycetota bacterium]
MKRLLLLLALATTASADTWTVMVALSDGSELRGTILLERVTYEGTFGTIGVHFRNIESLTIADGRMTIRARDASEFSGAPTQKSWPLLTSVGRVEIPVAKVRSLTVTGTKTGGLAIGDKPPVVPVDGDPSATGAATPAALAALRLPDELDARTLDLASTFAGPGIVSADGETLTAFDAGNARVLAIATVSMSVRAYADIPFPAPVPGAMSDAASWSAAPSGKIAFAARGRSAHVVDIAGLRVVKSFTLEQDVLDVAAISDDAFFASFPGGAALVTVSTQAPTVWWKDVRGLLHPAPDRHRVFTAQGTIFMDGGAWSWAPTGGKRDIEPLAFSADARFALHPDGRLFRVARGSVAEFALTATLPRHFAAAFLPSDKSILLLATNRKILFVDDTTGKPRRQYDAGSFGHLAAADTTRGVIYGFFSPGDSRPTARYAISTRLAGPGKWFRFAVPK